MKRKPQGYVEQYREKILELRATGLSSTGIAKLVPVCRSSIDQIIYPSIKARMKVYYAKRFKDLKKKGICHQCGQRLKAKSPNYPITKKIH